MSPKLQAVKDALKRFDKAPQCGRVHDETRKALMVAAQAAGFTPQRAVEDWARYQVAIGEAAEQLVVQEEPEPASGELFG